MRFVSFFFLSSLVIDVRIEKRKILKHDLLQENNQDQSSDSKQYLQTFTVVNSNINDQSSSSIENQQKR